MKTLMYTIAPDDDFPEMFCAIRQGSGEHWFYTPVGEDASWMLFRAESDNAKLLELVHVMAYCMQYERECDGCRMNGADGTITAPAGCDGLRDRMRELGVDE